MQAINVTLELTAQFKSAVLNGSDSAFGKLLDGCGADAPKDVPGTNQIEFDMWEDGYSTLEHWLKDQYPQDVISITRTP